MEQLQEAIKKITYYDTKFPEEEFEIICANKEEAIPYLRSAVKKVVKERDNLDRDYSLHFYAMYFLAEFQDRECFPDMMKLMCLPTEVLDYLIGDALTENAKDILYNTYNGNLELLKQAICDVSVNEYARSAMLDVMGQLYLDQQLDRQKLQEFLQELVYQKKRLGEYIYIELANVICQCHLVELLSEIRQLYQDGKMDIWGVGPYGEYVDSMFQYRSWHEAFCKSSIDAKKLLRGWATFDSPSDKKNSTKDMAKMIRDFSRELDKQRKRANAKVGRNDPCPCGSGKKYKKCCMNKTQNIIELLTSQEEQERWLRNYPPARTEETKDQENRIYLEDFYSQESIEIDKLLYLALQNRVAISLWQRESEDETDQRKRFYLTAAFKQFKEFVQKENIQSFSEYNKKYSIHYFCDEWTGILCELLKESDDEGILQDVQEIRKKMQ